jgi:hypothetical protein
MITKQLQKPVAVSDAAKQFITEQTETFGGVSASKEYMAATQKEVVDAMVAFVKLHRHERDEDGNITGDAFALEMSRTLALRAATSRAASAAAKVAEKDAEIEQLRALLAQLQGK